MRKLDERFNSEGVLQWLHHWHLVGFPNMPQDTESWVRRMIRNGAKNKVFTPPGDETGVGTDDRTSPLTHIHIRDLPEEVRISIEDRKPKTIKDFVHLTIDLYEGTYKPERGAQ